MAVPMPWASKNRISIQWWWWVDALFFLSLYLRTRIAIAIIRNINSMRPWEDFGSFSSFRLDFSSHTINFHRFDFAILHIFDFDVEWQRNGLNWHNTYRWWNAVPGRLGDGGEAEEIDFLCKSIWMCSLEECFGSIEAYARQFETVFDWFRMICWRLNNFVTVFRPIPAFGVCNWFALTLNRFRVSADVSPEPSTFSIVVPHYGIECSYIFCGSTLSTRPMRQFTANRIDDWVRKDTQLDETH